MRVLHVCSELYPLLKTGGLADVLGALPFAQKKLVLIRVFYCRLIPKFLQALRTRMLLQKLIILLVMLFCVRGNTMV